MLNPVDTQFIAKLRTELPEAAFIDDVAPYLSELRGAFHGQAGVVVAPASTQDVATIIRAASAARVPVVPYAGGTGLVGGQILPEGPSPLILSLARMSKIRGVYPQENVIVAEAGAILATVQDAARDADRLFPLSLGSEGTARIGGLLGTNAGGVNVLRYGNARELCLGLEAALPDGSIWNGLRRLRKDNTGYDLRNLLIGAEGTLGVVTAASLRLFPQPKAEGAALMVVENPKAALTLLNLAQSHAGGAISAFELIGGVGLKFLKEKLPDVRLPFQDIPEWMVLIDLGTSGTQTPEAILETIFADGFEAGLVNDGLIAQSQAQRAEFWKVRESLPEANRRVGAISSHDISIPMSAIPDFIAKAGAVLDQIGQYRVNCFGHLGDGNLHFNAFAMPGEAKADRIHEKPIIQEAVHNLVHTFDGSFSAEHGIGRLKVGDLERYGDPAKLAAMRAIKGALDPNGIMNPGAVLAAN